MPLVSVVIPAYNCESYIAETIESVLHQTFRQIEIIVVDDGSTDRTAAVLQKYRHLLKYVYQDNRGATAARNVAVHMAQGEFIAFLDNDDVWIPDKLSRQLEAITQYPKAALVFSDAAWVSDDGSTIRFSFGSRSKGRSGKYHCGLRDQISLLDIDGGQVIFGDWYPDLLTHNNFIVISSVLVRRSVLQQVGDADEALVLNSDYDLWLRIAQRFPLVYLNRPTVKYRVRDTAMSGQYGRRRFAYAPWDARLFEKHQKIGRAEFYPTIAARTAECYRIAAWDYFYHGQVDEARALNKRARSYAKFDVGLRLHALCLLLPDAMVERTRNAILGLRRTARRLLTRRAAVVIDQI